MWFDEHRFNILGLKIVIILSNHLFLNSSAIMDRLEQLIGKLKEQFEQKAPASQLLITTKQIEAELARAGSRRPEAIGTAKVAVVLPSAMKIAEAEEEKINEVKEEIKK